MTPSSPVAAGRHDIDEGASSRRSMLKKAGVAAAILWVPPTIDSLATPAAAGSVPVVTTVELRKSVNGSTDPTTEIICAGGAQGNAGRGSVVLTRSAGSPGTITAVVTLSTGASAIGREVFLLQSLSGTCVAGTETPIGVWDADPLLGPQTFSGPIQSGATGFVILLALSGGAGNDGWSTLGPAILV